MRQVYHYLSLRVHDRAGDFSDPAQQRQFEDLKGWLRALEQGSGTRSTAAKALGTLQKSQELSDEDVGSAIADLWSDFSGAFIKGQISDHPPQNIITSREGPDEIS